jgi:hypothetical protein
MDHNYEITEDQKKGREQNFLYIFDSFRQYLAMPQQILIDNHNKTLDQKLYCSNKE